MNGRLLSSDKLFTNPSRCYRAPLRTYKRDVDLSYHTASHIHVDYITSNTAMHTAASNSIESHEDCSV